ncbi:CBM1 domain-containing protein [Favolaschia claudopus]|uniref:CBM1 domain-containing protein n=1 Tax=Favolaschia claudopus TaxID=2862362 RepID=A0AAW0BWW4_9AGAR
MSHPMKVFNTKLTKLLGIRTPIVLPPMAGASGGNLAGQVSSAGGFGFLSAAYGTTPADFREQLSLARSAFQAPGSQHSAQVDFPVGVGYLAWQLEKSESTLVELLPIALEHNVQAIWFSFGERIAHWIKFVRDHDRRFGKDKRTLIFIQTSSVKEALIAANEWNADCIVVQGVESGGHGLNAALPLLNLVPLTMEAIQDGPPVVAAGGLANGAHLASMLTLGCSGCVFGTRFLLAKESLYTDVQREALIGASSESSVRSMAWDHARGSLGWPGGVDGRGLRNSTVKDFEAGIDIEELQRKFRDAVKQQDVDRCIVWAGTGVGQMSRVQSAKDIVEELHRETIERLEAATKLYV